MLPDDRERLMDMLTWCKRSIELASTMTRESLEIGYKDAYSLAYALQTIGEAASNLSREFCASNPQLPWSKITGMRHRLVHGYGKLDLDVIWNTCKKDIPVLMDQIERILQADE